MARVISSRRRWPAALVIALSALAIGAVVASPRDGHATSAAVPVNTGTPTITGTTQVSSTLSADHGAWTDSPSSYDYKWSRCDNNGDGCTDILGATGQTYVLQQDDVGHTLRVTVKATNADGHAEATSAPTAVIAAAAAAPANSVLPVISGTVQVGQTLTVDNGTWSGTPTAYAYSWSRCDTTGGSCAAISGATTQSYVLKTVDAGMTLRATVTATNSTGSTVATSAATALVPVVAPVTPPTVVTGCPSGAGVLQVADVTPPARLAIDGQTLTPSTFTLSDAMVTVHVRVTACSGRPVQGALVYVTAVPFNQLSIPSEAVTDSAGGADLTMTRQVGFPAAEKQRLLVMFIRARKPGDPIDGGISTRLLVSFPVSLS
jgi:hypothetical protein